MPCPAVLSIISQGSQWWWTLPLLVFLARIVDVSLGTLRVVFIARGMRLLAPMLGFFEVLVWLAAVAQVVNNVDNILGYLAYASGFALGTYVGLRIEERLAMGTLVVRIITQLEGSELAADLRRQNFGVTSLDAQGSTGPVKVIYTIIRRMDLRHVLRTISAFNPNAFYTIEDVRGASPDAARKLIARRQQPQLCPDMSEISRILAEINSPEKDS